MARDDFVLVEQIRPTGWRGWIYQFAVNLAVGIGRTLLFLRVEGTENIPRTGPVLVVANHPSYLDPPTLVALMIYFADRDVSIMAWDKLFNVPIVKFLARTYRAYPVDRANPGRGPYVTLLKILQNGGAAGVFPEGSRSDGRLMGPMKPGALRAAFATKATILPISFVTVGEFWPKKNWRPRFFRPHRIVVHKALSFEEYSGKMADGARAKEHQEGISEGIRATINAPILERQAEYEKHMRAKIAAADPWKAQDPTQKRHEKREQARRLLGA
jgi:1-acyl-sn-glycerol-3-phosphate acyltransferase